VHSAELLATEASPFKVNISIEKLKQYKSQSANQVPE
jgi:hypothetical protein